jgi:predicted phosphate transport protein (TIGR00153 family)
MHIDVCIRGSEALNKMMTESPSDQVESAKRIVLLEKEGDEITRQCIEDLHKTFITPFERNDIYHLMTRMDDILDAIEDVSARIVVYKLETRKKTIRITDILSTAIIELKKVVLGIRTKVSLEIMKPSLIHIHKLENEADDLSREAIGVLFEEEKNPIDLIKWKEIYEKLEEATDCCQSVANIIEGITMENS